MAGAPAQDMHTFPEKGFFEGKLESALKGGDLNPQSYIKKVYLAYNLLKSPHPI